MNLVVLKGRLSKDPVLRYTAGTGTAVCSFSIAVNRQVKEGQEKRADFFNCNAWGKRGEFVSKYFQKGQPIALSGRLQNRNWKDDNGHMHYSTEVFVDQIEFAGEAPNRKSDADDTNSQGDFYPIDEDDELPF